MQLKKDSYPVSAQVAERESVLNLNIFELKKKIIELGGESYRTAQIFEYIYKRQCDDFSLMSNLPAELRQKLTQKFIINPLKLLSVRNSIDGTMKFLFEMRDGNFIESVLIPSETEKGGSRLTLCVSTQSGCSLDCPFCATGKLGFKRNLEPSEIISQFLSSEKFSDKHITNIVLMGMGEPLLNFDYVVAALKILTDKNFKILSPKKITISTVGIVPGIKKFAESGLDVKLAVSLHATTDFLREMLIPIAKKWKLNALLNEIEYYYKATKLPVTYEYIVFEGLNNSPKDAQRLAKITRRVPSKVNLIPYNKVKLSRAKRLDIDLKPADMNTINAFAAELRRLGANIFIRQSAGADIAAACGQLAFSYENAR